MSAGVEALASCEPGSLAPPAAGCGRGGGASRCVVEPDPGLAGGPSQRYGGAAARCGTAGSARSGASPSLEVELGPRVGVGGLDRVDALVERAGQETDRHPRGDPAGPCQHDHGRGELHAVAGLRLEEVRDRVVLGEAAVGVLHGPGQLEGVGVVRRCGGTPGWPAPPRCGWRPRARPGPRGRGPPAPRPGRAAGRLRVPGRRRAAWGPARAALAAGRARRSHRVGLRRAVDHWRPGSGGRGPNGRRRGRPRRAGTALRSGVPGAGSPPRRRGTSCGPPRRRARGAARRTGLRLNRTGSLVGLPLLVSGRRSSTPTRSGVRFGAVRACTTGPAPASGRRGCGRGRASVLRPNWPSLNPVGVGGAPQAVDEVARGKVGEDDRAATTAAPGRRRRGCARAWQSRRRRRRRERRPEDEGGSGAPPSQRGDALAARP